MAKYGSDIGNMTYLLRILYHGYEKIRVGVAMDHSNHSGDVFCRIVQNTIREFSISARSARLLIVSLKCFAQSVM